jgi:hypothetical protein
VTPLNVDTTLVGVIAAALPHIPPRSLCCSAHTDRDFSPNTAFSRHVDAQGGIIIGWTVVVRGVKNWCHVP